MLIEHFREHKQDNHSISLFAFIQLHYFSGNPKDHDYDRDQQLPFRSDAVIVFNTSVEVPEFQFRIDPPPCYVEKTYPLLDITSLPSSHGHDIWQPPRSC